MAERAWHFNQKLCEALGVDPGTVYRIMIDATADGALVAVLYLWANHSPTELATEMANVLTDIRITASDKIKPEEIFPPGGQARARAEDAT
jgi:hypothetical protein